MTTIPSAEELVQMTKVENVQPGATPTNGHVGSIPAIDLGAYPKDDSGFAQLVNDLHGSRIAYTSGLGWLYFSGTHWIASEEGEGESEVRRVVESTLRALSDFYIESAKGLAPEDAAKVFRDARKCFPTSARVRAVLYMLEPHVMQSTGDFMPADHLLNCANGTVDLRTGELKPHDARDRFLYCVKTEYSPNAASELWEGLLSEWVGADLVDYLQRAAGYAMTGSTREECLFYLYGQKGRNGKDTFLGAIRDTLGHGVAAGASVEIFSGRSNDPQGFLISPLHRSRMVWATETNDRDGLNEAMIKRLTGGNRIQAAFKGKTPFDFLPKFKVFLSSNFPVKGDPDDEAFWRRFRVIQFPHLWAEADETDPEKITHYPDGRPRIIDKTIKERLGQPETREAILAWLVAGAVKWYAEGLPTPIIVRETLGQQRREQDFVGQWMEDCLEDDPSGVLGVDQLWGSWVQYCQASGFNERDRRWLGGKLNIKGWTSQNKRENGIVGNYRYGKKIVNHGSQGGHFS